MRTNSHALIPTGALIGLFRKQPKIACLPRSRNGIYLFLRRYSDTLPFVQGRIVRENGRVCYSRRDVLEWLHARVDGAAK
jgi:hypothetical protein